MNNKIDRGELRNVRIRTRNLNKREPTRSQKKFEARRFDLLIEKMKTGMLLIENEIFWKKLLNEPFLFVCSYQIVLNAISINYLTT